MKYTVLVNKQNQIKESLLKSIKLVPTKDIEEKEVFVEEKTYQQYLKLKEFLEHKNIMIGIDSAYRSLEKQQRIVTEYTMKYGEEYVEKYVAPVGTSEHHTGMAIDVALIVDGKKCISSDELLQKEAIFSIIHQYLSKYGFILRYPQGKEKITGYSYEPWHIRYVGEVPAKMIMENNLTLEEYLQDFSGILYINKPKGITSFDVVNEISHLFGIKRVGHTGTLDPLAEGVMIITIGKATKIVELLTAEDKEYIATLELGYQTDTYDNTGKVLARKEVPKDINIKESIASFQKTYLQEVPIYSAIKVNGKKLYEYARRNQEVTLPKKEVTIKKIELLKEEKNQFTFKALVTKGCYIRSLINDIGLSLNTYATMTHLIRTKQGKISLEETNTLEEIKEGKFTLHKIEEVLDYPKIKVDQELEYKIKNGVKIPNTWNIEDKVIILNQEDILLGIYQKEENDLKVWKNFV